jgi:hypothetical protein
MTASGRAALMAVGGPRNIANLRPRMLETPTDESSSVRSVKWGQLTGDPEPEESDPFAEASQFKRYSADLSPYGEHFY